MIKTSMTKTLWLPLIALLSCSRMPSAHGGLFVRAYQRCSAESGHGDHDVPALQWTSDQPAT